MTKHDNYNELILDFRDFLWKLAAQWKAIVIITLVIGTVFAGMMHLARVNAYNKSLEEEQKTEALVEDGLSYDEQLLRTLTDAERARVESVITNSAMIDELSTYLRESVRMSVDVYNVDTVNLQYSIRRKDGEAITDSAALSAGYNYCLNNSEFISGIKKDLGLDLEEQYIRELFSVEFSNTDTGAETLIADIKIIRPDDSIPLEKISDAVTGRLVEYTDKLSSEDNKSTFTLKLRNAEEGAEVRPEILEEKAEIMKKIADGNVSNAGQINTFNDTQLAVYEAIRDENGEEIEGLVNTGEEQKPSFGSNLLIIGWFIAFVIYVVAYALYVICRKRVHSADSLKDSYGLYVIGEVYPQSKPSLLGRLFKSSKVMKRYHNEKINCDEQFKHISNSIKATLAHCDSKQAVLLNALDPNAFQETAAENLINSVSPFGTEVMIRNDSRLTDSSIDDFVAECELPIIVLAGPETKTSIIRALISSCQYYGRELMGAIFIEEI